MRPSCSCLFSRHEGSSEIDVVAEAAFVCPFKKPQQGRPFGGACFSSDKDDDAVMTPRLGQRDEIVSIARDQETAVFVCKLQDRQVRGLRQKDVSDT